MAADREGEGCTQRRRGVVQVQVDSVGKLQARCEVWRRPSRNSPPANGCLSPTGTQPETENPGLRY